jgi:hypothetical protein
MNTASHHSKMVLWVLALAAGLVLAAAGTAWAQPPITYTESQKTAEGPYSDESTLCQTELYTTTFIGHSVEHVTYFPETEALNYHLSAHAKVVSVPLDGTGPTYTGTTRLVEGANIRNVKRGELVVVGRNLDRTVLKGSDGSKAFSFSHYQVVFNANGVKTVEFKTERLVCT